MSKSVRRNKNCKILKVDTTRVQSFELKYSQDVTTSCNGESLHIDFFKIRLSEKAVMPYVLNIKGFYTAIYLKIPLGTLLLLI